MRPIPFLTPIFLAGIVCLFMNAVESIYAPRQTAPDSAALPCHRRMPWYDVEKSSPIGRQEEPN